MLLNLNLQLDTSSSHITPLHPPSSLTSTSSITSSSSSSSLNPSRTHGHSQPFVHCRTQAHSRRANSSRCYQEPGEVTVSSLETGAFAVAPPPGPSTSDLPLHSPSEAANHSEAGWRAVNVLLGHTESTGGAPCLSHTGEILSVASDSQHHRLLRMEAQIDVMGDESGSHSNGLVPGRNLSRTAKTRTNTMASLSYSLRGARKCMDNEENSSSSDDEGKLVIELS